MDRGSFKVAWCFQISSGDEREVGTSLRGAEALVSTRGAGKRELIVCQAIVPDPNGVGHGQYWLRGWAGGKASTLRKLCVLPRLPWYCWASPNSIRATAVDDLPIPRRWKFGSLHAVLTPLFHACLNIQCKITKNNEVVHFRNFRAINLSNPWKNKK